MNLKERQVKTLGFISIFLVAGLALIGLSPGDTMAHLSTIGIFNCDGYPASREKPFQNTLVLICGVALAITIILIVVLPIILS